MPPRNTAIVPSPSCCSRPAPMPRPATTRAVPPPASPPKTGTLIWPRCCNDDPIWLRRTGRGGRRMDRRLCPCACAIHTSGSVATRRADSFRSAAGGLSDRSVGLTPRRCSLRRLRRDGRFAEVEPGHERLGAGAVHRDRRRVLRAHRQAELDWIVALHVRRYAQLIVPARSRRELNGERERALARLLHAQHVAGACLDRDLHGTVQLVQRLARQADADRLRRAIY